MNKEIKTGSNFRPSDNNDWCKIFDEGTQTDEWFLGCDFHGFTLSINTRFEYWIEKNRY